MDDLLKKILYAILAYIIAYLILGALIPFIRFRPYYDWWSRFGCTNCSNCMDLTSVAYYIYAPSLYFYIRTLMVSKNSQFKSQAWVSLISNIIVGTAEGLTKDGMTTPDTICKSIVPIKEPVDERLFKRWPTSVIAGGDDNKDDATKWSWPRLMADWAGLSWPVTISDFQNAEPSAWTSNRDNFLSKDWAIPLTSPLVEAFISGSANDINGSPVFPQLMHPLLGETTGNVLAGGWWGFLQTYDSDGSHSYADIARVLWASITPAAFADGAAKGAGGCNAADIASGAANMGIAGAFLGPAAPFTVPLGLIVGGALAAWQGGCIGGG